ncbi:natterin-4-like isoform X2 [Tyto alba]|uniref:natterin-4-like isoform X2 n=1 Tax=Tyto alba TaxID=56313 RepID=UPI001C66C03F|nr:natterin-4-like isoform X2 [Tyto alba]
MGVHATRRRFLSVSNRIFSEKPTHDAKFPQKAEKWRNFRYQSSSPGFSSFFVSHLFALLFPFRLWPFPGLACPRASSSCAGKRRSGQEVTQTGPKTPQKRDLHPRRSRGQLFLAAALLLLARGSSGADGAAESAPVGVGGRSALRPPPASWRLPRRRRAAEAPSYLKWVDFEGQLPADAVSNWNSYANRMEYVCSTERSGCNTGAYVPERGPSCFFPYGGWERSAPEFKVLVNVGDFEVLDWVDDSFGGVPKGAVEGCPSVDMFVGRNRYGLGKVSKVQRAAFMMVDGEEVWFKWYQVLVVKKGPAEVTISDVRYNVSGAVEGGEDVTLTKATMRNEGCREARKAVTLEGVTEREHDWAMDQGVFATVRGVLRAAPLAFDGTGWAVANVTTTVPWVGAASTSEYVVHTRVVEEKLQPRTACAVSLEGRRLAARTPFTARLTRDFGDGQVHRVAGTGWARGRVVVGVRARVQQCWPLADVQPCPA